MVGTHEDVHQMLLKFTESISSSYTFVASMFYPFPSSDVCDWPVDEVALAGVGALTRPDRPPARPHFIRALGSFVRARSSRTSSLRGVVGWSRVRLAGGVRPLQLWDCPARRHRVTRSHLAPVRRLTPHRIDPPDTPLAARTRGTRDSSSRDPHPSSALRMSSAASVTPALGTSPAVRTSDEHARTQPRHQPTPGPTDQRAQGHALAPALRASTVDALLLFSL